MAERAEQGREILPGRGLDHDGCGAGVDLCDRGVVLRHCEPQAISKEGNDGGQAADALARPREQRDCQQARAGRGHGVSHT